MPRRTHAGNRFWFLESALVKDFIDSYTLAYRDVTR